MAGSLLMPGILSELMASESTPDTDPLKPKASHFGSKAKRVIFGLLQWGVSHMDTFDYKPELFKADGKMTGIGAVCPTSNESY